MTSAQSKRRRLVIFLLYGMLALLAGPQVGRIANPYVQKWLWPPIPKLPVIETSSSLRFDGKDDFVKITIDWSYPQFTIEASVTSDHESDNGTIVSLASHGNPAAVEWMALYDDHQADPGKRLSGAAILGKTPYAGTYGPLTPGVREHRVLVFDSQHLRYYINGIWQGKRRAAAHEGLMWKMCELRIGCNGFERVFFQGHIDQVRISKIARYTDNFALVNRVANDDSTLALYNTDEGFGGVLNDTSEHGHHSTIFGATWSLPSLSQ